MVHTNYHGMHKKRIYNTHYNRLYKRKSRERVAYRRLRMRDYIITISGVFSFLIINVRSLKGVVTKKLQKV